MITFLKNPLRSVAVALQKSLPSNWFLQGRDGPASGGHRTAITDAYAQSTWVYAALNLIAGPVKAARYRMTDATTGNAIEDESVRAFWSSPARGAHETIDDATLIEATILARGVHGGVFWILDDSWMMRAMAKSPIILAAPSQMTALYDGRILSGWRYRDGAGRTHTYDVAQVIHLRLPNPGDPDSLDGIPPCQPSRESAEAARAGAKFARRVMDQNGDRGNFLIAKHALSPQQVEMLRAELAEKRRAADEGKYRDSVIGGDVEVVPNPISSVTTGFTGQVAMSRDEIFVAYGVPPSMAQAVASYSVGAASDWYRLIMGTCMAEAMVIAQARARVTEYLLGWRSLADEMEGKTTTGRDGRVRRVLCEPDFSGHPVMAEVRAARVGELATLFKMGMPIDRANQWLGLGIPEYDGWDERWMPAGLIPVEKATATDPAAASGKTPEPAAALAEVGDLVRQWSAGRAHARVRQIDLMRSKQWARIDKARDGQRRRVSKLLNRHIMAARAETLQKLRQQYSEERTFGTEYQLRAGVLDIVFDLAKWVDGLWSDMGKMLGGIFTTAAGEAADEIEDIRPEDAGDYDPLTEADPRVVDHLRGRKNLISGASQDEHQKLIASLEEGLQAGETLDQLSARVRGVFNDFSKVRAEVIARTETGAAYENARYWTFKDAGITQKSWLSGGEDGVTRPTHQAADGQVRAIDDLFAVGEARLLHPHDQIGGAQYPEELINCRCILIATG